MSDVVTDRAVLTSLVVAVLVVALSGALGAFARRLRLPALLVWVPAVVAGLVVTTADLGPYQRLPRDLAPWTAVVAVGAVAAVLAAWVGRRTRGWPTPASSSTLPAFAAVAAFLCVPETDVLRLLPGPLLVLAAAAVFGVVRPASALDHVAVAAAVAWLGVAGGQSRPAAVIGVAGALAVVAAVTALARPATPPPSDTGRRGLALLPGHEIGPLVVAGVAVLVCARVAGTSSSSALAAVVSVVTVAAVVVVLVRLAPDHSWTEGDGRWADPPARPTPTPLADRSGGPTS